MSEEFAGRNIGVIGLAATGLATAKVLQGRGATVTVYDGKPEDKLDAARVAEVRALDGVTFRPATDTVARDTDLVIPSPGVPGYSRVLTDAQTNGIPILGEIEIAYRLAKAPILAITGTNGKTTTTALVGTICREAGLPTWVAGNIAEDAGRRLPLIEAAMEAPEDGVIVAEISSFQLEWVERFRPKVAAWLNLSDDHLDRYKDIAEYARAKSNLFRAQTGGDFAVLNADDETVIRFAEGVGRGRRITFGLRDDTSDFFFDNEYILERLPDGKAQVWNHAREILLPGRHNIANVMAATAMTNAFGLGISEITGAIENFAGVAHRMEIVGEVNGVRYINNSMCTNPAALVASVGALDTPLIAIAGGVHKGGDLSAVGRALTEHTRHTILIGKSAEEFAAAIRAAGGTEFSFATTLPEAVVAAAAVAQEGETIMLVPGCASFDMFSGFEERGQVFRDSVRAL